MKPGKPGHMDEKGQRIAYLIAGYIRHTLTEEEHDELDAWINASDDNLKMFEELTDDENIQANLRWMDEVNVEKSFQRLVDRGAFTRPKRNWNWAIAAGLIILSGATILLFQKMNSGTASKIVVADTIAPGENRASLEFGSGKTIELNKNARAQLPIGTSSTHEGEIIYTTNSVSENHILRVPMGGQYKVQLSDGTKIWLNAQSMLTYPSNFADSIREVSLIGEGYFEVAKMDKPFIVRVGRYTTIRVLGTHFNINTYPNEPGTLITLLEGSVRITNQQQQALLAPGEQLLIRKDSMQQVATADTAEISGWKDGRFVFNATKIETIMRQVERWYGTTTVYQNKPGDSFNATIFRNEPVTKLLKLLETTGRIHFKIVNKTIYVLP